MGHFTGEVPGLADLVAVPEAREWVGSGKCRGRSTQTHVPPLAAGYVMYCRNFLVNRYLSTIHCTSTTITAVSKYRSNSILSILSLEQSVNGSRASGALVLCSVRAASSAVVLSLTCGLIDDRFLLNEITHSFFFNICFRDTSLICKNPTSKHTVT
jgi:hypothetical protein